MAVVPLSVVAVPPPPWRRWVDELWWTLQFADALLLVTARTGVRQVRRIPRIARAPIAAMVLVGYMTVRGVTGYLADPRPIAAVLAWPLLIAAAFVLFCAWACSGLAPVTHRTAHGSMTTRRTITGGTMLTARYVKDKRKPKPKPKFYTPRHTARHEGGHGAAVEACGGTIVAAHAYRDGSGWLRARLPHLSKLRHRVINYMSVMVAGEVATGSKAGCSHDQHWATWAADKLPKAERSGAWSRAYSMARWAQITHAATAQRVERALLTTGHYRGAGGSQHYL